MTANSIATGHEGAPRIFGTHQTISSSLDDDRDSLAAAENLQGISVPAALRQTAAAAYWDSMRRLPPLNKPIAGLLVSTAAAIAVVEIVRDPADPLDWLLPFAIGILLVFVFGFEWPIFTSNLRSKRVLFAVLAIGSLVLSAIVQFNEAFDDAPAQNRLPGPKPPELTNEQEKALLEVLSGRPAVAPQAQSDEQSEPDNDPVGPEQE